MAKKDHFLQQLQRRKMHLKQAPSHVDGPSEQTVEQLEAETKRLEWEAAKAQAEYWQERRQATSTAAGDGPMFGLASNQGKYGKRFPLPKRRRRQWK